MHLSLRLRCTLKNLRVSYKQPQHFGSMDKSRGLKFADTYAIKISEAYMKLFKSVR